MSLTSRATADRSPAVAAAATCWRARVDFPEPGSLTISRRVIQMPLRIFCKDNC